MFKRLMIAGAVALVVPIVTVVAASPLLDLPDSNVNFAVLSAEPISCYLDPADYPDVLGTYFNEDVTMEANGAVLQEVGRGSYAGRPPTLSELLSAPNNSYTAEGYNYELVDYEDDYSKYSYRIDDGTNVSLDVSACIKMEVEITGDSDTLTFTSDESVPDGWQGYLDLMSSRLPIDSALVVSDVVNYEPGGLVSSYSYLAEGGTSWRTPGPYIDQGRATIIKHISFPESVFPHRLSFDYHFAMNNTLNIRTQMYERPWFDVVRHYNSGTNFPETSLTDNYITVDNFFRTGTDYPNKPEILTQDYTNSVLSFSFKPVANAVGYEIAYHSDDLDKIEFDTLVSKDEITGTSYTVEVDYRPRIRDCYLVRAIDEYGVRGPAANRVCVGSFFTDVNSTDWFANYTDLAAESGLLSGYRDGNNQLTGQFGPYGEITKAEALKMVMEMAGRNMDRELFQFELPFSIPANLEAHWAADYIFSAHVFELDLVSDINSFNPNEPITRGELMNLIAEILVAVVPNDAPERFTDVAASPYRSTINYFADLGVVSGYKNTSLFGPNDPLRRAEAAKILVEVRDHFTLSKPGVEI